MMQKESKAGRFLLKDSIFSKLYGFFHKKPEFSAIITQNVEFPDVSFYQGNINWDIVKTHTLGAIIRAGQNTWIDPQFARNYSEAKRVGLKRGVYWFYDSRVSPQVQAQILINLIIDDHPEMEVFCDWEYDYGGNYFDLKYAVQFMKYINGALPTVRVGMYTGYYFFKDHTNPTTHFVEYDYLKDKPLWLAWYTSNPAYVQIPAPWTKITHWQYTSNGDGSLWGTESGNVDLNWYNGTEQEFKQNYGGVVTPPDPPDTGGRVDYSNGVSIINKRYYDSDVTTYLIPSASIKNATFDYVQGSCRFVEEIDYDFACNFTPFTLCKPNLGLRVNGYEYEPYHNYNPYLILDGIPTITHVAKQFRNYATVSQGFRYIIERGVKNPNFNSDWDNLEPRRLVGVTLGGDLVIITAKGRQTGQRGWTLHEAADYGLSLGLYMMIDGDSGSSTQEYAKINGVKQLNLGVASSQRSAVAVFIGIDFKSPLVDTVTPPEPTGDWVKLTWPDGIEQYYDKRV